MAPRTPLENKLKDIWSEVLDIEKIGINDNFFTLGGNSLLATQVVSRIRNRFEINLPLRYLFEFTTIGELSEYLSSFDLAKSMITFSAKHNREIGEI